MDKEKEIEKTHHLIKENCPHIKIDSLEAVKQVEEYRQYWKPDKTNIVLLAESHVYTDQNDFKRKLNRAFIQKNLPNYPSNFVRFVYCLGYGEDTLLNGEKGSRENTGTPQFWKIFASCIATNPDNPRHYRILKSATPSFTERLQNKISILSEMKQKGIWLMDASIVGLYGNEAKNDLSACDRIIEICWNNYIEGIVEQAEPKFVIIIGKGVEKIISHKLRIPFEAIDLPSAYIDATKLRSNYRRYTEICTAILNNQPTPPRTEPIQPVPKPPKTSLNQSRYQPSSTQKQTSGKLENILTERGYKQTSKNGWVKSNRFVQVVNSLEHDFYVRVTWKEKWRNYYAIIFDYSAVNGPICVVPTKALFETNFVIEKRRTVAYANSGYWWTQKFPENHELSQLIIEHKNHWDLL
ncbi:MAG: hypothetical protein QM398_11880 [Thermoproteota archaeon]|mgnify:CR=1 FL=1|nr:hypothetical protein [Thermoproteota archaeon]